LAPLALCALLLAACATGSTGPSSSNSATATTATTTAKQPDPCLGADCVLGSGIASGRLIVEPDDGETPFRQAIASATSSVWVEMYLLTDTNIINALEEAANRGVDVRVLLEMHPLGGDPTGPQRTFDTLAAAGVHMKASNTLYRFTHEKAIIVDGATVYVMTCNLTKSALGGTSSATNREYAIVDTNADEVREAQTIFQADWDRTQPRLTDPNLLVSPMNSRPKLEQLLQSAKSSLIVEEEEMYDADMEDQLIAAAKRGVAVQVVLPAPTDPSAASDVPRLTQAGIHVRYSQTLYMHAKMIVADGARAFVGSENFSGTSLDGNRELGIIVADPVALAQLKGTFASDWGNATSA
jgi:phosphatidylserine/phosphatidylglycerophosphate/cardiolipin synthase-like enzyme